MKQIVGKVIGIFLALAGLVGVVVQLLSTPGRLGTGSLLLLSAVLIIFGLWIVFYSTWRSYKTARALPQIAQLEDICTGYHISPATYEEVDWIARQEEEVYLSGDAIPKHVLSEWYNANPEGFSVIKMPNGQKIGHIDLLPVRPNTLATFIEGNIVEKDIRGDSLYSPQERSQIKNLYVESIAVVPPKRFSNAPAVLCVLTNFGDLVARVCDLDTVENVYAIAASRSGEALLRRLGFDQIRPAQGRKDQHDLYRVAFADLAKNITTICGRRFPEESIEKTISNKASSVMPSS